MLYTNHPHNLDVLFYSHIKSSLLAVDTAEEADAILVPFWVNKFVKLDQELEKPNRQASVTIIGFLPWLSCQTLFTLALSICSKRVWM